MKIILVAAMTALSFASSAHAGDISKYVSDPSDFSVSEGITTVSIFGESKSICQQKLEAAALEVGKNKTVLKALSCEHRGTTNFIGMILYN